MVATPGRLGEHIKAGTLKLHQCQAIVMDEADVLLGDAYAFSAQVCRTARVSGSAMIYPNLAATEVRLSNASHCKRAIALILLPALSQYHDTMEWLWLGEHFLCLSHHAI